MVRESQFLKPKTVPNFSSWYFFSRVTTRDPTARGISTAIVPHLSSCFTSRITIATRCVATPSSE
jgi:hypothetical protein